MSSAYFVATCIGQTYPYRIPLQDVNVADLIQRQEEFNRAILKQLEQFEEQQKKRDENLILALKESIETKNDRCSSTKKFGGNFGNRTPMTMAHLYTPLCEC